MDRAAAIRVDMARCVRQLANAEKSAPDLEARARFFEPPGVPLVQNPSLSCLPCAQFRKTGLVLLQGVRAAALEALRSLTIPDVRPAFPASASLLARETRCETGLRA
jgi:hypothetical protein